MSCIVLLAIMINSPADDFYSADLHIPGPSEQVAHKPASNEQVLKAKAVKQKKGAPKPAPKPTAAITTRYAASTNIKLMLT